MLVLNSLTKAQLAELITNWLEVSKITSIANKSVITFFSEFLTHLNVNVPKRDELDKLFFDLESKNEDVFVKTILQHIYKDNFDELANTLKKTNLLPTEQFGIMNNTLKMLSILDFSDEVKRKEIFNIVTSTINVLVVNKD